MSKTWDELSNDAFKLAEDLYNDMIARGIEINPKSKSKYDELSKLHQPTVISSVCNCSKFHDKNEVLENKCSSCGEELH